MLLGRVCDKKIVIMIELSGITKSFGTLQVLKGIDLLIGKGEIVSIVGPSGAGKTTLLQIMGTLDKADAGTVILNGTEVNRLKEKRTVGFSQSADRLCFSVSSVIAGIYSIGECDDTGIHIRSFFGRCDEACQRNIGFSGACRTSFS